MIPNSLLFPIPAKTGNVPPRTPETRAGELPFLLNPSVPTARFYAIILLVNVDEGGSRLFRKRLLDYTASHPRTVTIATRSTTILPKVHRLTVTIATRSTIILSKVFPLTVTTATRSTIILPKAHPRSHHRDTINTILPKVHSRRVTFATRSTIILPKVVTIL
jgi:hypothetical protein